MLKSGWWLTSSLMDLPANWVSRAVYNYQKGSKVAITNLFRKIYQRENCKNLESVVIHWRKNKLFSPWQSHILSVPVLLLVAEGIATDFCKKSDVHKRSDRSNGGEKIKKAVRQKYTQFSHLLPSNLYLLESAINTTIYQDTNHIKIKKRLRINILNRRAVLHGLKKNYGTMKISLQALILLDVLSELK